MKVSRFALLILLCAAARIPADNQYYQVKKNDTPWSISREFGVSVESLMKANAIKDETALAVGMRLVIPSVYVVEKNDTLWSISVKHSTTVQILRDLNVLDSDTLLPGDEILVPANETSNSPDIAGSNTAEKSIVVITEAVQKIESVGGVPFWPLTGARNVRTGKLSGTEITGKQGDEVISVASGEVVWNDVYRGYGKFIIIKTNDNYLYLFAGLEESFVEFGQKVNAGMKIAELGLDPHTGEAKLLFSVVKNGQQVDPASAPRG